MGVFMASARPARLLLATAFAALVAGYFLGRLTADGPRPMRAVQPPPAAGGTWEEDLFYDWAATPEPPGHDLPPAATAPDPELEREPVPPGELLDALRRHADSPRSQAMLLGLVADAARVGGAMLPEIRRLLESGVDISFRSYDPRQPGYPSLRVALLAAAEATGDPAAIALISEVAQTTESPVEMVFSAHLLDRLDALDAQTAQRTLDALARPLDKDQRKAMAAVVGQVIPAVARADPGYAENFLATQLRIVEGPRADPRLLAPLLDGLPLERASSIVLSTLTAADVGEREKSLLAGRAAQRGELDMLADLRQAVESNLVPEKVSAAIARGALAGGPYGRLDRQMRQAIRQGDLEYAQRLAREYEDRLVEASRTVTAARRAGAKVPQALDTRATLYRQSFDALLGQIRHAHEKRLKEQAKAQRQG